jgi:hypothetical protein
MSLDEYMRWVTDYYYNSTNTTPRQNGTPVFIDPLSLEAYYKWKNTTSHGDISPSNPNYVPGHPETSNGSIIYIPTPIPCPTPTPMPVDDPWSREIHQAQPNIQLPPPDNEGNIPGILAWDAEHTRGLYPYYTPGDHAVIGLRFVNNFYPKEIKNPEVSLVLKKQVLGQYIVVQEAKWIEPITIPAIGVDQYEGHLISNLVGFNTTVYEFNVPDSIKYSGFNVDSSGNYVIEVSVYVDNVRACWLSKMITIV